MSYLGSKGGHGVSEWLINNIPKHVRYFELFGGSAQLFLKKKPAKFNLLNDIDPLAPAVVDKTVYLSGIDKSNSGGSCELVFENNAALAVIDKYDFTSDDFIYLDPPYPFDSRRSPKQHFYNFEMSDVDHLKLLSSITDLKCNIMISTRQNCLYGTELKNWRLKEFVTSDRGGRCIEQIYMNYDEPQELHQYNYLGDNSTERQRINRKVSRHLSKLEQLPVLERNKILIAINNKFRLKT